jgi:hypothetical protein
MPLPRRHLYAEREARGQRCGAAPGTSLPQGKLCRYDAPAEDSGYKGVEDVLRDYAAGLRAAERDSAPGLVALAEASAYDQDAGWVV